jgi:hypothetical protein
MDFSDRQFHAHFGVSKSTILILFSILQKVQITYEYTFTLDHLLWTFYFLKVYNSVDVSAEHFHIDCKTYRLWIWRVLLILFLHLDTVKILLIINNLDSFGRSIC